MSFTLFALILLVAIVISFRSGGLTKQEEIRRQLTMWNCYNFPERYESVTLNAGGHGKLEKRRVAVYERIMGSVEQRQP